MNDADALFSTTSVDQVVERFIAMKDYRKVHIENVMQQTFRISELSLYVRV